MQFVKHKIIHFKSLKKHNIQLADHIICPSNRVKDDLINYIEQVLEHGLLKPTAIEEEDWELHWSEKMLFKNLKVSQLKELPQKYQSLLGFKDGKKVEINKIVEIELKLNNIKTTLAQLLES